MRPLQWWAESAPPGGDMVKVSENLGPTSVAPVAPVDTSLLHKLSEAFKTSKQRGISDWGVSMASYLLCMYILE